MPSTPFDMTRGSPCSAETNRTGGEETRVIVAAFPVPSFVFESLGSDGLTGL